MRIAARLTHLGMSAKGIGEKLLYEERVTVVPGGASGESDPDHVRACYATSREKPEVAVRLSRFVEKYAR